MGTGMLLGTWAGSSGDMRGGRSVAHAPGALGEDEVIDYVSRGSRWRSDALFVSWMGLLLIEVVCLFGCSAVLHHATNQEGATGVVSYEGTVAVGGETLPVTTTLFRNAGTVRSGAYAFLYQERPWPGILSDCRATAPREVRCRWQDRYGRGTFQMVFTEDLSSFDGFWTSDLQDRGQTFAWNGTTASGKSEDSPLVLESVSSRMEKIANCGDLSECGPDDCQCQFDHYACEDFETAERELHRGYEELLQRVRNDQGLLDRVSQAQRAWYTFREAQITALYGGGEGGGSRRMCEWGARQWLTENRTGDLRRMVSNPDERDVCTWVRPNDVARGEGGAGARCP
jgi:uncharacterized protein YecT (DUF1311 family)